MGREQRSNHEECGDNRERKYSREVAGGTVWFCHNCGDKGFEPAGLQRPRDTIKLAHRAYGGAIVGDVFSGIVRLPSDYTTVISVIPLAGMAWLYKYGLTDEEITRYGIGYSETYQRLILPVFDNETLVYWQGRNLNPPFTKENPKYLNIRQSGAKNVFFRVRNDTALDSSVLVVVEDVISAIKVGRLYHSLALLGSYFPSSLWEEFKNYETIIFYLDDDKYKTAIKEAIHFASITSKKIKIKRNIKDPKELSTEELQCFLTA